MKRIKKYLNTPGPLTPMKSMREKVGEYLLQNGTISDGTYTYKPYASVYPDVYKGYENDINNPENPLLTDEYYEGEDGELHVRKKAIPYAALNKVYVRNDGLIVTADDLDLYTYNFNDNNRLLQSPKYHSDVMRMPYHDQFRDYRMMTDEYGNLVKKPELIGPDTWHDPSENVLNDLLLAGIGTGRIATNTAGKVAEEVLTPTADELLATAMNRMFNGGATTIGLRVSNALDYLNPSHYLGAGNYSTVLGGVNRSALGATADTALAAYEANTAYNELRENPNVGTIANLGMNTLPFVFPVVAHGRIPIDMHNIITSKRVNRYLLPVITNAEAVQLTKEGYTPEEILSAAKVEYPLEGESGGFRASPQILRNIVINAYKNAGELIPDGVSSSGIPFLRGIHQRIGNEVHSGAHGSQWWHAENDPFSVFDFFYLRRLHPRFHDADLSTIDRKPYIGTVTIEDPTSFSTQSYGLGAKEVAEGIGTLRVLLPKYGRIERGGLNILGGVGEYDFSGVDKEILKKIVSESGGYRLKDKDLGIDKKLNFEFDPDNNLLIKDDLGEVLGIGKKMTKLLTADQINARIDHLFNVRRYRGSDGRRRTIREIYEDPNGYYQGDPTSGYQGVPFEDFLNLFKIIVTPSVFGGLSGPSLGGIQYMKRGKLIKRLR